MRVGLAHQVGEPGADVTSGLLDEAGGGLVRWLLVRGLARALRALVTVQNSGRSVLKRYRSSRDPPPACGAPASSPTRARGPTPLVWGYPSKQIAEFEVVAEHVKAPVAAEPLQLGRSVVTGQPTARCRQRIAARRSFSVSGDRFLPRSRAWQAATSALAGGRGGRPLLRHQAHRTVTFSAFWRRLWLQTGKNPSRKTLLTFP